jgi:DNA-binding response OmpR family regulator
MQAATEIRTGEILVIEDEPEIEALVTRALDAVGFRVTVAETGLSGLSLARSGNYDLVVLDLVLPDVDGISILGSLRELMPEQRVLVMSALADSHSKVRCLELGACDYVTKPFELAELVERVRLRLRERQSADQTRHLRSEHYSLDLQRRVVFVGDKQVLLSSREFGLLEHLMRNEGEVCGRDDLLGQVWGLSFNPATNVVDVCIARLRQKLGADCIQTVRSVGYSFVDC